MFIFLLKKVQVSTGDSTPLYWDNSNDPLYWDNINDPFYW